MSLSLSRRPLHPPGTELQPDARSAQPAVQPASRVPDRAVGELSLGRAFLELEPFRESLLRFLERRCGSRHDAEDVVQEALLRAVRYRCTPRWPDRIEPWLRTIAANVLTDRRRRFHRRREVSEFEDELFDLCSSSPDPSLGIDDDDEVWFAGRPYGKQWLLSLIRRVLAESSAVDREVLLAYYAPGGGSCGELSRRLGVQAGVVKVRLYRARRRLRRRCLEHLTEEPADGSTDSAAEGRRAGVAA